MKAEDILRECMEKVAKDNGWDDWASVNLPTETKESLLFQASLLAMSKVAEQSFEAGGNHLHAEHFGPIPNPHPSKSEYLKSKGITE